MSMEFVHTDTPEIGTKALADALGESLKAGKRTLWLICGGSNIAVAVSAMHSLHATIAPDLLGLLTVMQTDERFGPVGHPDSNWTQLEEQHFPFDVVRALPILQNQSLEETIERYGLRAEEEFNLAESIVALFGIGVDSHIAGILPHSKAATSSLSIDGYVGTPYTRISLTFPMLRRIDQAFVFAFGETKRNAIESLHDLPLPLEEAPCHILREIPSVTVYSDSN